MMKTYYLMLEEHGEADAVGKMKQFATYFTHGVRNGSKLRTEIYRAQDVKRILDIVDAFFNDQLQELPALECAEVA
jgi:tRNA-dihydrouridine synthase